MMFGGRTDAKTSHAIIANARDRGCKFIDTADVYNRGESERIVGRAIDRHRDEWILATKLGNKSGKGPNGQGLSRKRVFDACDCSLRRLGTDYIDIYYLHREDLTTPLPETVRAMGDVIASGKVRYFGLSNFRAWRVAEVSRICDELGMDRPVVSQPYYNLLNRMPEAEHLPACDHYGLGVFPYSPLARGVLSGKYEADVPPPSETRAGANDKRIMETEWRRESLLIVRDLTTHCEKLGISTVQFALSWLLNNRLVTGVICGPRTLEQWEAYVTGLDYQFTSEDEALVDGFVTTGHPSTPGYNDPAYPLQGRQPRTQS
jgi:aryl-alcohol dehydrogenase (NADP+)